MTVAESLKRFRRDLGLTQREVAMQLELLPQAYNRYESGKYLPNAEILIKLAKAYDVTADYLLGLSDEPRPKPADAQLVSAIKRCRDSIQQVLNEVDRLKVQ